MLYRFIVAGYGLIPEKVKNEYQSIYQTMRILIDNSEGVVADTILDEMPEFIREYKYLNISYLKML